MNGFSAIDVDEELKYCVGIAHSIADSTEDGMTALRAAGMILDMIMIQTKINCKAYEMNHPIRMFMHTTKEEE